ncbi:DeoR/GlpR transcriptional regulator [Actinobacteria bacterium YIM 96077]|uniref:Lactose phosphotransferase system repressor n=1 Tax=Phytoactinopolyspora halophila TaxID=1981511 RepID=A0A329QZV8_9ACTN|nr:DeoR/GlpR family DNA-binding transcription regulator [Phytoactinopolyspora halophila]AYY11706.1 DeoR/GlpR transcriptional regulator [Actinobacteria bacterium YIM 96077]RAW17861.1 DeoR/GlpR transcriptional regulator [Phytoactinopolyspora halophila]
MVRGIDTDMEHDRPLRYDNAPRRRERILEIVRTSGFVSVVELTHELGVSGMTVRRDLRKLEDSGEVRSVYGGVTLPSDGNLSGFDSRAMENAEAKHAIATMAMRFVQANDTIAIDAGSTTACVAVNLDGNFAGAVVSHSVPVIQLLVDRPGVHVIGLGGDLLQSSRAFVGPMTVDAAGRLQVRTLFLGAAAVDERGFYGVTDIERPTKHALIEIAERVVLVIDHTKFAAFAPVRLGPLSQLSAVVTDSEPPTPIAQAFAESGVELHVAHAQG